MALSKKHYVAIAAIMSQRFAADRTIRDSDSRTAAWHTAADIAEELADYFARDNDRFDRERFLRACGVQS